VARVVSNNIWKIQTHTDLFQTNAFGTLEFQVAEALTTKAEVSKLFNLVSMNSLDV
jgi:hypothetical protein